MPQVVGDKAAAPPVAADEAAVSPVAADEAAMSPVAADEAAAHPGIPGLEDQAGGSTHKVGTGSCPSKTGSSQGGDAISRVRSCPACPALASCSAWHPWLPGLQALFHYMGLAPHPSPYSAATLPFPLLDAWERLEAVPLRGGYVMSPGLV